MAVYGHREQPAMAVTPAGRSTSQGKRPTIRDVILADRDICDPATGRPTGWSLFGVLDGLRAAAVSALLQLW